MPGRKSDAVLKWCVCVCARWQRLKVHYGPRLFWATAARVAPRPFYSGPWLDKGLPPSWFAAVLSRPDFTRCSKRASGGTRHLLPHLPHLHFSALAHTHTVLFTAFPDLAITMYNRGEKKTERGRGTEGTQQRDVFNRVWGTSCIRVTAVGPEFCLPNPLALCLFAPIFWFQGHRKETVALKHTMYASLLAWPIWLLLYFPH